MTEVVVPEWLRAGCCVELWDPSHPHVLRWPDYYSVSAGVRYREARAEWLSDQGRSVYDQAVPLDSSPWSFVESERLGTIAEDLAARGLPSDWRPVAVPSMVR